MMRPIKRYSKTRRDEEMSKYVYLCFTKWSARTTGENWRKKHDELCKENGVEVVCFGPVFGVVEDWVIGYGTDMHRDAFQEFRGKVWNLDPEAISYTKTFQVLSR